MEQEEVRGALEGEPQISGAEGLAREEIRLFDYLPEILFRNNPAFRSLTGYSPRSLANLDSKGLGPKRRVRVGKVTGYPKLEMTEWLVRRTKVLR